MVDLSMVQLVEKYHGIDPKIPIKIWVEEICDPIIVLDTQGNILPSEPQIPLSKEEQLKFLLTDIDFNDTYESNATQEFTKVGEDDAIPRVNDPVHEDNAEPAVNDPVHEDNDAESEVNVMNNEEEVPTSPIEYGDYFAEGWDDFLQEDDDIEPREEDQRSRSTQKRKQKAIVIEENKQSSKSTQKRKGIVIEEDLQSNRKSDKGKGKMFPEDVQSRNATEYMDSEDSRSEFDDSSDADYIQEEEVEESEEGEMADAAEDDRADEDNEFSDTPSFLLEDIEGSSDDDIFTEKNPSKHTLYKRLRKFMAANKKEDDDLISLDESENENEDRGEQRRRHACFREGDWNMKGKTLLKGMKFQNFKVYREALRDYCVRMGVDIHFIRNEASRITARCKQSSCSLAKTKYIAKRLEKIIRDYSFVSTEQLKNNVSRRIGLEVSAQKIARARNEVIAKIVGEDGKQYELLWDYCETVRAKNPGSQILLRMKEGAESPVFDKMYFSLAAMKNGFLAGCRPIIQLDGCFLKTLFGGQLLVAVGRDGNDNMVPIALAVVQVENLENWKWFLSVMLQDIGGLDQSHKWTFITDRQKGLLEAIVELAPYAEHRYCVRHMYENFKKKYSSMELKNLFWSAAFSANRADFEMYMQRIERVDPKVDDNIKTASEWLRELPSQHWCRASFRTTNKPIISMFEWIRTRLMSRIQNRRVGMENYASVICPNIRKRVDKQQSLARHCWARFCGGSEFEIDHLLDKYVVDLLLKTCTCGMFQLCGYPCCHACAAISERRGEVDDYVDDCFKKEAYLRVYEHMIHAVPGQRDYIKTNYPILRAPAIKRKRGRPRKRRIRGAGECVDSTRVGLTHICKNCLQLGHNKGSCTNPTHPKSKFYKGPAAAVEEPYEPVQTDHEIATQSSAAPQPTQASQNDPSSQPSVLPNTSRKQQTRGGKGRTSSQPAKVGSTLSNSGLRKQSSRSGGDKGRTYLGRRNAALLSACSNVNQQSSSNVPTEIGSNPRNNATATDSTRGKTTPSLVRGTGAAVAGTTSLPKTTNSAAPTAVGKKRKPNIADALKNIRQRVQEKRPKQ
ncbi:hypothetical protein BUALT_Bualt06G0055000 [Buddleja alternifolia]|uniref:SWIM-type domain-containing protein n=1 Tax=Buddleja alternifolia TaxID=168488 RepID=A0AAV6XEE6_9LAMI|nr:hypothetical protein BUALT_Bualt06G0055000 [Buddleja alternifolia]